MNTEHRETFRTRTRSPRVRRLTSTLAFGIALLGLTSPRAGAEPTITASNVILAPGGTGTMDFTITSGSGDTLSSFGLELLITKVGNPASLLQFTTAQPDPYGNMSYVFAGESFNGDADPILPLWGNPTTTHYPNDTISGGDSDDSNQSYVTIGAAAGDPHSYLGAVQFSIPQGAMLGDQFQVSLVTDPNFTYVDDESGDPLTYSFAGGLVTIATIPEPSTLSMAAIASLGGLLGYLRSRRRAMTCREG
jgi:hypothetical protein